jgi:hypothetical protein
MRIPFARLAIVACLAAPAVAPAADEKPHYIIAVKSFDGLLADGEYLAEKAGQAGNWKQAKGLLKIDAVAEVLKAFDAKKPVGVYGWINGDDPTKSEFVVLLPIADEQAALTLLKNNNVKAEKGSDGIYKAENPNSPDPVFFTFANKYAYITQRDKAPLTKERLIAPENVLPAEGTSLLSAIFYIDRIPEKDREKSVKNLTEEMEKGRKEAPADETPAMKVFRLAAIDEAEAFAKSLVMDGAEARFSADVDRKTDDLSMSMKFTAKPGTKLAGSIAALTTHQGLGAGVLTPDAAGGGVFHFAAPESLRKSMADALDDAVKKALEKEEDKEKRALLESLAKAVLPTLKEGELDYGGDFHGPSAKGTFTGVAALKLKSGLEAEKQIKNVLKGLPADQQAKIKDCLTVDFAKAGDVNVHSLKVDEILKAVPNGESGRESFKKAYGNGPVLFAFRDDALIVAVGEDAMAALKDAVAGLKPKPTPVMQFEYSLAKLESLMPAEVKGWGDAAKKAFKNKGDDKVSLKIEGGSALTMKLSAKAAIIAFGAAMAEAQKK